MSSQEAYEEVERELKISLKRKKPEGTEKKEIDLNQSAGIETETETPTDTELPSNPPKKAKLEDSCNNNSSQEDSAPFSLTDSTLLQLDSASSQEEEPKEVFLESKGTRKPMKRSNSLDLISKNPPVKILRVALTKSKELLNQEAKEEKYYKKLKCWLKIGQKAAASLGRNAEFSKYINQLMEDLRKDKEIQTILEELFPSEIKH